MANRQLQRKVLLQTLYEWDMRGFDNQALSSYFQYTAEKFNELDASDQQELQDMLTELSKKRVVIDEIIEKAAPAWPLEKISMTDRNVLRIGLFELLFGDREQIPPKVAINEAIELSKKFGGPKSGKFVNGVIGAVYREIGEPGKEDTGKAKMPEVAYEDMPIEQKGSAVVFSIDDQGIVRIGMVHDVFGYWTLPKGGIDDGETLEDGTIREIKEETNWEVKLIEKLGDNEYIAYPPEKGPTRKQVTYFLAQSDYTVPTLNTESGGLDDIRWFELNEIADLNIYDDVSQMLIKSVEIISGLEGTSNTQEVNLGAAQPDVQAPDFSSMKVAELRELAKERDLEGYSGLKKAELIELLSQS
jgi:N utilization substance protein B